MKLTELLLENELKEKMIDEIGKFYAVNKPGKGMTKEDMVYEANVFTNIEENSCIGVYKNRSEANRKATDALLEYDRMMKEVEDAMSEYRTAKTDIEEKRKSAKDKIKALQ